MADGGAGGCHIGHKVIHACLLELPQIHALVVEGLEGVGAVHTQHEDLLADGMEPVTDLLPEGRPAPAVELDPLLPGVFPDPVGALCHALVIVTQAGNFLREDKACVCHKLLCHVHGVVVHIHTAATGAEVVRHMQAGEAVVLHHGADLVHKVILIPGAVGKALEHIQAPPLIAEPLADLGVV